jgi:glycosyltransferase involved in cell wall biosynthesis
LVQALRTLLSDRAMRQHLGSRGREIVQREFSVEIIVQQTLTLYEEMG